MMVMLAALFAPHMLAVAAALVTLILVHRYARLRHFPGPTLAAWSDWPHSLAMLGQRCHEWYAAMNNTYGPIVRIAPNILITSSPDLWIHVNVKPGYKRSDCTLDEKAPRLEATVDQRLRELIALLRSDVHLSQPARQAAASVDLGQKVQFFTLDVISSVGLGTPLGLLRRDADPVGFVRLGEEGLVAANVALAAGLGRLAHVPWLGRLLAPSPRDAIGYGTVMAACFRCVDERCGADAGSKSLHDTAEAGTETGPLAGDDMLASFARHGVAPADLRSEALEQLVAGSDTTAGALRYALLLLMTNPRVLAELRREADAAVARGAAPPTHFGPGSGSGTVMDTDSPGSTPGDPSTAREPPCPIIPAAQARRLPYLQAVVREALRLHPPAANIFARDVPAGGDNVVIEGARRLALPAGTSTGVSVVAMQRRPDIFGPHAYVFRPERWLAHPADDDAAWPRAKDDACDPPSDHRSRLAAMTRANDLVFGHGRSSCLGRTVAVMQLSKAIFELVRCFDMAPIDPLRPWKTRNCMGLILISDMRVQVTQREPRPS